MSQEIILKLPQSESHKELLERKIGDYWEKAVKLTAKCGGISEPPTVLPGREIDVLFWDDDTVAKAMIAREIIRFLLDNNTFERNQINQVELYEFLVAKIGLERIEKLLDGVMVKLFAYVTYEFRLRNSLPTETT